jgi:AcrR family transcriptional regulator
MSFCIHVGNKEGLLAAVVERLMRSLKIDLDSEAAWLAQAEQWAHAPRQQLRMNIRGLEAGDDLN